MLLLLKSCLLLAAGLFASEAVAVTCANADNCYRALFPCPSPSAVSAAAAFCATITSGGVTATNYPTRATAACGTAPARYISACACGPTCSSSIATSTTTASACTPTPSNGGLVYGDFECGTAPWTVEVLDTAMSVNAVDGLGLTGKKSLVTKFTGPSTCGTSVCTNARITSPQLSVTPGTKYKLTFGTWMDGNTQGFVGVRINGRGRTVDAFDFPQSIWKFNQVSWTAQASETSTNIIFEWLGPEARLDTITFAPATAYCGPHPPLGIMPDGEFECGLGGWTSQKPDPGATAGVVNLSGGSIETFGNFAWKVFSPTDPIPANQELGVSARLISPSVPVTPGKTYLIGFTAYFDNFGIGFIGLMVNNQPFRTYDPGDRGVGTGWFSPQQYFWTAPVGVTAAVVKFEAVMGKAGTMMVDSVIFVEATGTNF
ncbi:hypothetical protein B0H63DRAFT_415418 [Podospora didyma]|uniref:CBM-cenC domain-containing protein n=1 Tax=Podospora didyma TaxID=330526 RepID=A0AAE0NR65_9PEZI|nr:hypothetical protein B0H63DRAFT_415418 [Podospora didyma]